MKRVALLGLLLIAGCAPKEEGFMPLKVGSTWTYSVQGDFDTFVDIVKVTRRVPVAGLEGYEIVGGMGVSRVAWAGSVLLASELGGQWFDPPVPIFSMKKQNWRGVWETAGKGRSSTGTIESQQTKETIAGRSYDAIETTVRLQIQNKSTVLTTWYVQGIGILKQEQRTNDHRDRRIEYLSGP